MKCQEILKKTYFNLPLPATTSSNCLGEQQGRGAQSIFYHISESNHVHNISFILLIVDYQHFFLPNWLVAHGENRPEAETTVADRNPAAELLCEQPNWFTCSVSPKIPVLSGAFTSSVNAASDMAASQQNPENEAVKWNSAIISFNIYTRAGPTLTSQNVHEKVSSLVNS